MVCQNCGKNISNAAAFCPFCGTTTPPQGTAQNGGYQPNYGAQQTPNQNYANQPNYGAQQMSNQNYANKPYGAQQTPYQNNGATGLTWDIIKRNNCVIGADGRQYGIGWLKFILYFQLFAFAITGVLNGILFLTGSMYGANRELVYRYFDGLQGLDIVIGILFIILGVAAVGSRYLLINLKKKGPISYYALCGANIVINLIYLIASSAIISGAGASMAASVVPGMIANIALLIANTVYFRNRANIFIY